LLRSTRNDEGPLVAILVGYSLLTTLMKRYYIRRFGWQ